MQLHQDAVTKILSDEDIAEIAQQPPSFRKHYSRYWNSDGKIKEPYFRIIFRRDAQGHFIIPEEYVASGTTTDVWNMMSLTRLGQAHYLMADTVKPRYLCAFSQSA